MKTKLIKNNITQRYPWFKIATISVLLSIALIVTAILSIESFHSAGDSFENIINLAVITSILTTISSLFSTITTNIWRKIVSFLYIILSMAIILSWAHLTKGVYW